MSTRPKSSASRTRKPNQQAAEKDPLAELRDFDRRIPGARVSPPPASPAPPDESDVQRRFADLSEVAMSLGSAVDLKEILDRIVDGVIHVTHCDRGFVILVDSDGSAATYNGRRRDRQPWDESDARRISSGVLARVLDERKPFIVSDVQQVDELRDRGSIQEGRILAVVCLPILWEDRLIGAIYADSGFVIPPFYRSDRSLELFAYQAALAIENARTQGELKQRGDALEQQNLGFTRQLAREFAAQGLISKSRAMFEMFEVVDKIASSEMTVMLLGESGTGKELMARAIHNKSPRAERPFFAVNCSSIPLDLVESTLFGHARGAFSGAVVDQAGLFEVANGGTVFLDEIGDMPLVTQPKLLRVLEERSFERVGEIGRARNTDVRIISATKVDLVGAVADGRFREDLFYRLNAAVLQMPALRDRREDILPLAEYWLDRLATDVKKPRPHLSADARTLLLNHTWPGNVRELRNALAGGTTFQDAQGTIHARDLARFLVSSPGTPRPIEGTLREQVERLEADVLRRALVEHDGNVTGVSRALGLSRQQLYNKFHKYGIAFRSDD